MLREKLNKLNEEKRRKEAELIILRKREELMKKAKGKKRLSLEEMKILYGEVEE